ncbi:MAG: hypothetical protein AAF500_22015 [Myxococcota bacterium]
MLRFSRDLQRHCERFAGAGYVKLTAPVGRHLPIRAFYESRAEAKAWAKLLDFFERHMPSPEKSR